MIIMRLQQSSSYVEYHLLFSKGRPAKINKARFYKIAFYLLVNISLDSSDVISINLS